jgi:hypothetical protein
MKKTSLIFAIAFLFVFLFNTKAQEMQQIKVYKGGVISYSAKLDITDSITFYNKKWFFHIKKGVTVKSIKISEIDSITFFSFTVPNNSTGVLINGTLWATCNLESLGKFTPQPYFAGCYYKKWGESLHQCPEGWLLANKVEYENLINSETFWGKLNDIPGRFFGNDNQKVFFPVSGFQALDGSFYPYNTVGNYWSSTSYNSGKDKPPDDDDPPPMAYVLNFSEILVPLYAPNGATVIPINQNYGFLLRCVRK